MENFQYERPTSPAQLSDAELETLQRYDVPVPDNPDWIASMMQKTVQLAALSHKEIRDACARVQTLDTSKLHDHAAFEARVNIVKPVREQQLARIQLSIQQDQENLTTLRDRAISFTQYRYSDDPATRVSQAFDLHDIRNHLRNITPIAERRQAIVDAIEKRDFRFVEAAINPIPLVDPGWLEEARLDAAYKAVPSLRKAREDAEIIATYRRQWLAHTNAETLKMLEGAGFEEDPVGLERYFEAFPVPDDSRRARLRERWTHRQKEIQERIKVFREAVKQGKIPTPKSKQKAA